MPMLCVLQPLHFLSKTFHCKLSGFFFQFFLVGDLEMVWVMCMFDIIFTHITVSSVISFASGWGGISVCAHACIHDSNIFMYVHSFLCRELYQEKCVMNNYFGIGLDAKVTLEFQNKREEHPEKCRQVIFSHLIVMYFFSDSLHLLWLFFCWSCILLLAKILSAFELFPVIGLL